MNKHTKENLDTWELTESQRAEVERLIDERDKFETALIAISNFGYNTHAYCASLANSALKEVGTK